MSNLRTIEEAFEFVRNGASIKQQDGASGIPITRIETIWNSAIDEDRFGYANIEDAADYKNHLLQDGDILMSHINSPKHLGKCAIYKNNPRTLIHGMNLLNLRPNKNVLSPQFAFYFLSSNSFRQDITKISNQSVNQASFSTTSLKKLKIPLPPLAEQQKIATILDAADSLRQKDQQLVERYTTLSQSLFLEMFGDPVTNPMGWKLILLEQACEKIYGGGTPSKSKPEFYIGEIPWVTPKDMKTEYISNSIDHINQMAVDGSSVKLIPPETVLMVIRSGVLKHTLPLSICTREVTINQDMKAFIPKTEKTNSHYLLHFFKGVEKYLLGKVRAVTADNIEFRQIRELHFPLPPLLAQTQFAERIKLIEAQKKQAQVSLQKSEALFNSLLQQAFTGELTAKKMQ